MATKPQARYTYDDLQSFPEDNLRREIIDGELIVTAAPATRHQRVVVELVVRLHEYARANGGQVLPAPALFGRGQTMGSPQIPGLKLSVEDLLGPPED